jgi:hypothetical protein
MLAQSTGPKREWGAVIRNGLRWRDAPRGYGPHKTIYNRFVRWSRLGVFNKIFAELASKGGKPRRLIIDATRLKAHRTAASLLKKGLDPSGAAECSKLKFIIILNLLCYEISSEIKIDRFISEYKFACHRKQVRHSPEVRF